MKFDYDTRWQFAHEIERKGQNETFRELFVDDLTKQQAAILGGYLFGVNPDYAAAGAFLAEIAQPAAEYLVRQFRERAKPDELDKFDALADRKYDEHLNRD